MAIFESTTVFDKNRTYSLRGICMMMIIIHHIVLLYGEPSFLFFTTSWGYLGTGVFFFLSGFGLFFSLNKRVTVPISWIVNKVAKILLPFIFAFGIYILLSFFFEPKELTLDRLTDLLCLRIPHTTSWFLKAILGLYVVTFICFYVIKNDKIRVFSILAAVVCFFLYAYLNMSAEWHWTILNFPLGMISGLYMDKIKNLLTPLYKRSNFLLSFMIICLSFFILRRWGFTTISSLIFTIISMLFILQINVCNRLFDYVGSKSINFYIFQMIFLHYGLMFCHKWWLYFFFVIVTTFALSITYDMIVK